MTETAGKKELQIGMLVLEHNTLERKIATLRDEISRRAGTFAQVGRTLLFQPERLAWNGQTVGEDFAGEPAIERTDLDVDSLVADLRAAILRKKACAVELVDLGIDFEEAEREKNLRDSRAIWNPANVRYGPDDGAAKQSKIGFTKPRKKSEES
jgi:hypothetical protein